MRVRPNHPTLRMRHAAQEHGNGSIVSSMTSEPLCPSRTSRASHDFPRARTSTLHGPVSSPHTHFTPHLPLGLPPASAAPQLAHCPLSCLECLQLRSRCRAGCVESQMSHLLRAGSNQDGNSAALRPWPPLHRSNNHFQVSEAI